MSTPAIIELKGATVCIYKHWDGNPKSVLPWLVDYIDHNKSRITDDDYFMAGLLRWIEQPETIEKYGDYVDAHASHSYKKDFTGWGVLCVSEKQSYSYDYHYLINPTGEITVNGGEEDE